MPDTILVLIGVAIGVAVTLGAIVGFTARKVRQLQRSGLGLGLETSLRPEPSHLHVVVDDLENEEGSP